jgi:predicted nucleic acid-binding protein
MPGEPPTDAVVLHASAVLDALLGTEAGVAVRVRIRGCQLHAPAHIDAQILGALERLNRSGDLSDAQTDALFGELAAAPIERHELSALIGRAWAGRNRHRPADGLYVELAAALGDLPLLMTDLDLAETCDLAEPAAPIPVLAELIARQTPPTASGSR